MSTIQSTGLARSVDVSQLKDDLEKSPSLVKEIINFIPELKSDYEKFAIAIKAIPKCMCDSPEVDLFYKTFPREEVKSILELRPEGSRLNDLLLCAIRDSDVAKAGFLVESGANLNSIVQGNDLLVEALFESSDEMVSFILNHPDYKLTTNQKELWEHYRRACSCHKESAVRFFFNKINDKNYPFLLEAISGYLHFFAMELIKYGMPFGEAEFNRACDTRDYDLIFTMIHKKEKEQDKLFLENALIIAAEKNIHKAVDHLLKEIDINCKNAHGQNALMRAIREHRESMVKKLIDKGIDITAKDNQGKTALDISLDGVSSCFYAAALLIEKGMQFNRLEQQDETLYYCCRCPQYEDLFVKLLDGAVNLTFHPLRKHYNLFSLAIEYDMKKAVRALVQKGAPLQTNDTTNHPLMVVVVEKRYEIAKMLIRLYNPEQINQIRDYNDQTLGTKLLQQGNIKMLALFIKHGLDCTTIKTQYNTLAEDLAGSHEDHPATEELIIYLLKSKMQQPSEDLFIKANYGKMLKLESYLVKNHPECIDKKLRIEDLAIEKSLEYYENGFLRDVRFLKEAIVSGYNEFFFRFIQDNPDGLKSLKPKDIFKTPSKEIFRHIAEKGLNIDQEDKDKLIAYACVQGNAESVKYLLDQGASLFWTYKGIRIHMMHLAVTNSEEIVQLLLDAGASIDVQDIAANTPLHMASSSEEGNEKMVEFLIKKGAIIEFKNNKGETPLMCAFKAYKMECAKKLIELGADLKCFTDMDNDNDAFYDIAKAYKSLDLIQLMVDKGFGYQFRDFYGKTIFHEMCEHTNYWVSVELFDYMVELDQKSNFLTVQDLKYFLGKANGEGKLAIERYLAQKENDTKKLGFFSGLTTTKNKELATEINDKYAFGSTESREEIYALYERLGGVEQAAIPAILLTELNICHKFTQAERNRLFDVFRNEEFTGDKRESVLALLRAMAIRRYAICYNDGPMNLKKMLMLLSKEKSENLEQFCEDLMYLISRSDIDWVMEYITNSDMLKVKARHLREEEDS